MKEIIIQLDDKMRLRLIVPENLESSEGTRGLPFKVHLSREKFIPIERNGVSLGCSVLWCYHHLYHCRSFFVFVCQ